MKEKCARSHNDRGHRKNCLEKGEARVVDERGKGDEEGF